MFYQFIAPFSILITIEFLLTTAFKMANQHDKVRIKVITLGENTEKSTREIADIAGVNQSTVSRILKKYRETGQDSTQYANCGGHNKKFYERDLRHIKQLSLSNPKASANEIRLELGAAGDEVSVSTVRRALVKIGFKIRKPSKKPLLTDNHKILRLQWARNHQNWVLEDWKTVIWSDETMIHIGDGKHKFVRVLDGYPLTDAHYDLTVKFPLKIMIWSCFSWFGTGRALQVEGSLNSQQYIETIIEGRLIQQLQQWFPNGSGIYQQDNAPCHKSKLSMACFRRHGIRLLDWPAQSPDLNPIENMWAIMKQHMNKLNMRNKPELMAAFIRVWNRDEEIQEICKVLVESLPRRIQAVIDQRGGHTKY